jgi:hypothetical protein
MVKLQHDANGQYKITLPKAHNRSNRGGKEEIDIKIILRPKKAILYADESRMKTKSIKQEVTLGNYAEFESS